MRQKCPWWRCPLTRVAPRPPRKDLEIHKGYHLVHLYEKRRQQRRRKDHHDQISQFRRIQAHESEFRVSFLHLFGNTRIHDTPPREERERKKKVFVMRLLENTAGTYLNLLPIVSHQFTILLKLPTEILKLVRVLLTSSSKSDLSSYTARLYQIPNA